MESFKDFLLNERIEYQLKVPNSSTEFVVYKIQSKNELKGLLNKYKVLRILFNSINTYAWDAMEADHSFVKKYIPNNDTYFGFIIENNKIIQSIEKNNELIDQFEKRYYK